MAIRENCDQNKQHNSGERNMDDRKTKEERFNKETIQTHKKRRCEDKKTRVNGDKREKRLKKHNTRAVEEYGDRRTKDERYRYMKGRRCGDKATTEHGDKAIRKKKLNIQRRKKHER